jgi:hypothetical protein
MGQTHVLPPSFHRLTLRSATATAQRAVSTIKHAASACHHLFMIMRGFTFGGYHYHLPK